MQIYATQIIGISLEATDGKIGKIKDLYFDDSALEVRYLVVETGSWLLKRRVLIAPCAIKYENNSRLEMLPVSLNRKQVKNSPDIDTDMPVSRQQEQGLFNHYSWPNYGGIGVFAKTVYSLDRSPEEENNFDPHLRSFRHVSQYEVYNAEGLVGQTKDLMVDLKNWSISSLLVNDVFTSDKERVVIAASDIVDIDCTSYKVTISLKANELDRAPIINAGGFFSKESARFPPLT